MGDIQILELLGETETTEAIEHPHVPDLDDNFSNSGLEIGLANPYSTDFGFKKWAYVEGLEDLFDFPPIAWNQWTIDWVQTWMPNMIEDALDPSWNGYSKSTDVWCIFKDWENLESVGYPNMEIGTVIKVGDEYIYIYDKIELSTYNYDGFYDDNKYSRKSACIYKVRRNVPVIFNGEYINPLETIPVHIRDEQVLIYSSQYINFDGEVNVVNEPKDTNYLK